MRLKSLLNCFVQGAINTVKHDGIEHAGYLAFLGLLALFPFLVFITALLGFLGENTLAADYLTPIFHKLPKQIVDALDPRIKEITLGPPQGLLTLAIVGTLWTASSAVEGIRTTLNRAYQVSTPPTYLLRRTLSIVQLIIFAFILLVGMLVLLVLPMIIHRMEAIIGVPFMTPDSILAGRIAYIITVLLIFGVVASIYYSLPNIKQCFKSVAPGALLVVVLWSLAARVFTYYLQHFNQLTIVYGSLGGIISALLFFYICNVIFIYGAEFNHLFMESTGVRTEEKEYTGLPPEGE